MAHDVFISYSSKDKTVADALCGVLESQGIPCWIAPRNIAYGSDYGEAIVDGINESRVMVLVFSSNANTSPHIKREVDRAVSKSLTIIPIRIEDVAPTRALEYYISPVHWLDAIAPPLEPHLHALGEKIQVLLGKMGAERAAAAPPTLAPAAPAIGAPAPPAVIGPSARTATAPVSPAPPEPRRVSWGLMMGGAFAVLALVALFWAQPWNPGDKTREAAGRQAQLDEERRKDATRQAQAEEQKRQDTARQAQTDEHRRQDAARQALLDDQRRRDTAQAENTRRAAEEATKRADDATRRLEAARLAEEARVAKALAEQKRQTEQIVPRPPPTRDPGPVAALDPAAAKGMVEQKLRGRGLLKQSAGNQWGVTVEITSGGVVTLTGVLQNNEQRNETVRLAADVPGVTEVKQRINVQQSWNTR
jgi:osmotically-inducible protein OsmY